MGDKVRDLYQSLLNQAVRGESTAQERPNPPRTKSRADESVGNQGSYERILADFVSKPDKISSKLTSDII